MATRMGTGIGKGDAGWECGKDAAQEAVDVIGPDGRPGLVIVFASPHYNHNDVLKGIQSVTGDAPLIGCSSAGDFTEHGALSQSVVVVAVSSDSMRFIVGCGRHLSRDLSPAVGEATANFRGSSPESQGTGLVHGSILFFVDGLGGGGETLINEITVQTALRYQLVGGAAGDDVKFETTPVFYQDEVVTDAFVCAEILSTAPLGIGISHGWSPIGPKMRVTRSQGLIVNEINGRPALDAYKDFARENGIILEEETVVPFLMDHIIGWLYQEGDQKLRVTLRSLDDGSVLCASEVPEGSLISLTKATDQSVIETSGRASRLALGSLEGFPPAGMIAFECVSQRLRLGEVGVEQQLMRVKNVVGVVPLAGCHGYGQLARARGAFTGFMSASALVCLYPQI